MLPQLPEVEQRIVRTFVEEQVLDVDVIWKFQEEGIDAQELIDRVGRWVRLISQREQMREMRRWRALYEREMRLRALWGGEVCFDQIRAMDR